MSNNSSNDLLGEELDLIENNNTMLDIEVDQNKNENPRITC